MILVESKGYFYGEMQNLRKTQTCQMFPVLCQIPSEEPINKMEALAGAFIVYIAKKELYCFDGKNICKLPCRNSINEIASGSNDKAVLFGVSEEKMLYKWEIQEQILNSSYNIHTSIIQLDKKYSSKTILCNNVRIFPPVCGLIYEEEIIGSEKVDFDATFAPMKNEVAGLIKEGIGKLVDSYDKPWVETEDFMNWTGPFEKHKSKIYNGTAENNLTKTNNSKANRRYDPNKKDARNKMKSFLDINKRFIDEFNKNSKIFDNVLLTHNKPIESKEDQDLLSISDLAKNSSENNDFSNKDPVPVITTISPETGKEPITQNPLETLISCSANSLVHFNDVSDGSSPVIFKNVVNVGKALKEEEQKLKSQICKRSNNLKQQMKNDAKLLSKFQEFSKSLLNSHGSSTEMSKSYDRIAKDSREQKKGKIIDSSYKIYKLVKLRLREAIKKIKEKSKIKNMQNIVMQKTKLPYILNRVFNKFLCARSRKCLQTWKKVCIDCAYKIVAQRKMKVQAVRILSRSIYLEIKKNLLHFFACIKRKSTNKKAIIKVSKMIEKIYLSNKFMMWHKKAKSWKNIKRTLSTFSEMIILKIKSNIFIGVLKKRNDLMKKLNVICEYQARESKQIALDKLILYYEQCAKVEKLIKSAHIKHIYGFWKRLYKSKKDNTVNLFQKIKSIYSNNVKTSFEKIKHFVEKRRKCLMVSHYLIKAFLSKKSYVKLFNRIFKKRYLDFMQKCNQRYQNKSRIKFLCLVLDQQSKQALKCIYKYNGEKLIIQLKRMVNLNKGIQLLHTIENLRNNKSLINALSILLKKVKVNKGAKLITFSILKIYAKIMQRSLNEIKSFDYFRSKKIKNCGFSFNVLKNSIIENGHNKKFQAYYAKALLKNLISTRWHLFIEKTQEKSLSNNISINKGLQIIKEISRPRLHTYLNTFKSNLQIPIIKLKTKTKIKQPTKSKIPQDRTRNSQKEKEELSIQQQNLCDSKGSSVCTRKHIPSAKSTNRLATDVSSTRDTSQNKSCYISSFASSKNSCNHSLIEPSQSLFSDIAEEYQVNNLIPNDHSNRIKASDYIANKQKGLIGELVDVIPSPLKFAKSPIPEHVVNKSTISKYQKRDKSNGKYVTIGSIITEQTKYCYANKKKLIKISNYELIWIYEFL